MSSSRRTDARIALLIWALLALTGISARAETITANGPVYLVYAGPYSPSPSSAFGHLFLIAADTVDEPTLLWDVISFSADTYDANVVRYFFQGISGGFLGRYRISPFHQQSRDYQILDDRNLWLIRLDLPPEQRTALNEQIETEADRYYPYTSSTRTAPTTSSVSCPRPSASSLLPEAP